MLDRRKTNLAAEDGIDMLHAERGSLTAQISGHEVEIGLRRIRCCTIEVAFQRQAEIFCAGQTGIIGRDPPRQRHRHSLDMHPDTEIAYPHFAQGPIHISEKHVVECLSEVLCLQLVAEPMERQKEMQEDHVEPAIQRVRDSMLGIELRQSRLNNQGTIDCVNSHSIRPAAEETEHARAHDGS